MIQINSPGVFDASLIDYDNISSGLSATEVKSAIDECVADGNYAECSTSGDTAAKTATIDNFSLRKGVKAIISFTNANTAPSPTLNISNTGAKPLYADGTAISSSLIKEDSLFLVVYDGTNYSIIGGVGGGDYFVGTTSEWEVLSSSEKASYDNKLVIITDDSSGGGGASNLPLYEFEESPTHKAHALNDKLFFDLKPYHLTVSSLAVSSLLIKPGNTGANIAEDLTAGEDYGVVGIPGGGGIG